MTRSVHPPCPRCGKPLPACVCDLAAHLPTRLRVLVLQHPQESRQPLSSAPLLPLLLARASVRVGLSWPNLRRALGDDTASPARYGVLHLGTRREAERAREGREGGRASEGERASEGRFEGGPLEGLVVLDGSWKQARALWWRNPWLSKLRRVALAPGPPSRYGDLRLAARAEGLSTLEATGRALTLLGEDPAIERRLGEAFGRFLDRYAAMLRGGS